MTKQLFAKAATIVMIFAASLLGMSSALAQNAPIRGTVVDSGNQPVIGAAVMVPGTTTGATTNIDGAVTSKDGNVIATAKKAVTTTADVNYGVQKKSDLTGSVASVRTAELSDRSTSDAAAALQGKAAGVQIFNASGAPGSGSEIRVRGLSSNGSAGLGPLLIVDGLKVDNIQYLDPAMIESIEVLKDAASAAIYGAQAGNGVVLITTKSGANAKGRDGNIFYNYKLTLNTVGKKAEVMNAQQYIDWNERAGHWTREEIIADGKWDGKTETDWASVVFGTGISHNHTFGAQGSNDRGKYYISLNYTDQDGMVVGNKDFYKRLTAQVNADYKIKSWFQVGTNTSIERYRSQSLSERSEYSNGENGTSLLGALVIDPLTPVYYTSYDQLPIGMKDAIAAGITVYRPADHPDWYYATSKLQEGDGGNPLVFRDRNQSKNEGWNIRGTVFANFTPIKELVITSRLGYRIAQSYSSNYLEPYYLNFKLNYSNYAITASSSQNYYYQWENFANYNKVFAGKHALVHRLVDVQHRNIIAVISCHPLVGAFQTSLYGKKVRIVKSFYRRGNVQLIVKARVLGIIKCEFIIPLGSGSDHLIIVSGKYSDSSIVIGRTEDLRILINHKIGFKRSIFVLGVAADLLGIVTYGDSIAVILLLIEISQTTCQNRRCKQPQQKQYE